MGYLSSCRALRAGFWIAVLQVIGCGGNAQISTTSPSAGGSGVASGGQAAAGQSTTQPSPSAAGAGQAGAARSGSSPGGDTGTAGALTQTAGAAGVSEAGGPNAGPCAGPLSFADPDVERVVRRVAGVPSRPLFASDVAGITDLSELFTVFGANSPCGAPNDCPRPDPPALDDWISSIAGLECLPNVQTIEFDAWYVRDFTPFAALSKLKKLYLGLAPDLSSLPPLPQVIDFGVFYTPGALSGLKSLPNVTSLAISAMDLSAADALEPIAKMHDLRTLQLTNSHVTNVSALAGLQQLVAMNLRDNDITDLSPLAQNAALGVGTTIELYENPIACESDANVQALRARGVVIHCN